MLYVANAGHPVSHEDFTAMCRVAMSNKRPDEGIGNKGVGFKSVLQLADSPEIYSEAEAGSGRFDGYCFRFAQPGDFDDLAARVAPAETGLADELRENVASLKVPVPLDTCPDVVDEFAVRGFATVIRLVLRSPQARDHARRQLAELTASQVPFHLFLERVASLVVTTVGADHRTRTIHSRRQSARTFTRDDLALDDVVLQDTQRFLLLRKRVPEAVVKEAIAHSRSDGRISAGWDRWRGDARVCVALPLDTSLAQGRLYTFLPMGETVLAPLAGFVNAPFFARLDRRSLDTEIPLNDLLLDEVAALCARVTQLAVGGELELAPGLAVDLVAWRNPFLPRLVKAFDDLGARVSDVPFIPALGERRPRTAISAGWLWETNTTAFTPAAVAAAGVDHIIDPVLAPQRRRRLKQLADDLGFDLTPGDDQLAMWAESYADALARTPLDADAWAEFYDDLAAVMANGAPLAGKWIILDEHGRVIRAGSGDDGGPTVFLAPQVVDDAQTSSLSPPPAVGERIAFTHPAIAWRSADPRRKRLSGREWLKQQDLVQEYHTDAVLNLVGTVMRGADGADDGLLRSCLLFAYAVWGNAARQVAADVVARAGLFVPAAGGWRPADGALFGAGWAGPKRALDDLLVRLLSRTRSSAVFTDLAECLIPAPQTLLENRDDDPDRLRVFLEHAGVQHGLMLRWLPSRSFRLVGSRVGAPATAPDLPIDVPTEHQRTWRGVAAQWPRQLAVRPTAEYEPTTPVAVLPGQFEHSSLDPDARRVYAELILYGLDQWPDHALEFQYKRPGDARTVAWPTLVAAFLATGDWLPQTTPGQRAEVEFMSPTRAWWLAAAETPDFLRAQPPALRNLATPTVLARLKKIGVRCWDDPATATDRLIELTDLIGTHRGGRGQPSLAVRKAYEAAWRDLVNTAGAVPVREPLQVLAARAGRLTVVPVAEGTETVYVADESGVAQERLLRQAPVLMLAIRNRALAERVRVLLTAAGARCLRSTADAGVRITIDGWSASTAPRVPLLPAVGRWLTALVLGAMEFRSRTFPEITSAQLRRAVQRLDTATLTIADEVSTSIDGYEVDDPRPVRSFLLESDNAPCVVVAGARNQPTLAMLQAASYGLAELVGIATEADNLRLAFIDLQQRCGGTDPPTPADIASVLGVAVDDVTTLIAAHAGQTDVSPVIALLACLDIDLAEELQDARDQFDSPDTLRAWLTPRLGTHDLTAEELLALADRGDLLQALRTLDIDLASANCGLRALALPPLHNADGHARQVAAYLQQHRSELQDRIRDAFLPTYRAGEPLDAYLHLLQLPGLEPDEAWLDTHWDVPEQVLADHVESWLHHTTPGGGASELPPIDITRDANRRSLNRILSNAVPLVDAWLHRHSAGQGNRPADFTTVADTMTRNGLLDFERLTTPVVARWLHNNHQWPAGMPLTTNRAELGITDEDVADARQRIENDKDQKRRATTFVKLDGQTYSTDTDILALADAVRESLTPQLLATPAQPLTLIESRSVPAIGTRSESRFGRGSYTAPRPETLQTIGLAGEVAVGEWLRHHFGIPPEDSWVSGNRNLLLNDGKGDDSLGYDFRITRPDRTRLFEVKAATDDHTEFIVGETEVRRAQNLQPDEEYTIIFVTHVLDSTHRRIIPLPNPLAPGGLNHYQVAGRSIRLRFQLHEA